MMSNILGSLLNTKIAVVGCLKAKVVEESERCGLCFS